MSARGDLARSVDAALPAPLDARPVGPDDEPVVRALHATTLPPGLAGGPLADLQLVAQRRGFRTAFPDGEELVVRRADAVVARVCVGREAGGVRLVDVVVDTGVRRQGVGRAVVGAVQDAAAAEGLVVRLQVVRGETPAEALYATTGFVVDEAPADDGVRRSLVWPG